MNPFGLKEIKEENFIRTSTRPKWVKPKIAGTSLETPQESHDGDSDYKLDPISRLTSASPEDWSAIRKTSSSTRAELQPSSTLSRESESHEMVENLRPPTQLSPLDKTSSDPKLRSASQVLSDKSREPVLRSALDKFRKGILDKRSPKGD